MFAATRACRTPQNQLMVVRTLHVLHRLSQPSLAHANPARRIRTSGTGGYSFPRHSHPSIAAAESAPGCGTVVCQNQTGRLL